MAELSVRLLALLGKMADKGDEEDVHKLRTTVRRLEVQLGQCPPKIAKSLKSLRRKAGKVRDVDVHLGLLRSSLFTGPAAAPNAAAVCDKLRRALESERERHVESLLRVVEDAAPLLEARLPKVVQHAAIGVALFTVVIFMRDLGRLLEIVVRDSAPLPSVAELFFLTLPVACTITIPMMTRFQSPNVRCSRTTPSPKDPDAASL